MPEQPQKIIPIDTRMYKQYIVELKYEWPVLQEGLDRDTGDIIYRNFDLFEFYNDHKVAYYDGAPPGFPEEADVENYMKVRRTVDVHTYSGQKYVTADAEDTKEWTYNNFVGWKHTLSTYSHEMTVLNPQDQGGGIDIVFSTNNLDFGDYQYFQQFYVLKKNNKLTYYPKKTKSILIDVGENKYVNNPSLTGTGSVNAYWYDPSKKDPTIPPEDDYGQGTLAPIIAGVAPVGVSKIKLLNMTTLGEFTWKLKILGDLAGEGYTSNMELLDYVSYGWVVHNSPPNPSDPRPPGVDVDIPASDDDGFTPIEELP